MTALIWSIFIVLALVWTASAAVLAQLIKWSVPGLAMVGEASGGALAATVAMPAWLSPFIDPAFWTAMQESMTGVVASLPAMMPFLGEVATWLVPVVWVVWGLGCLSLLTLSLASTWMLHRLRAPVGQVKDGHLMAFWRALRR